jgi:hypothetical protein
MYDIQVFCLGHMHCVVEAGVKGFDVALDHYVGFQSLKDEIATGQEFFYIHLITQIIKMSCFE